ncbi:hypothetical protein Tco_0921540 [Tanacetum coccineum]
MANFPRLQELATVGNSNNLNNAMSVYIQREINADLQFAVRLSQLWDVLYNRVNEIRSDYDVGAKEDDSGNGDEWMMIRLGMCLLGR